LANVVEQCRANNMPKASIEAAIHGAVGPGGFWGEGDRGIDSSKLGGGDP